MKRVLILFMFLGVLCSGAWAEILILGTNVTDLNNLSNDKIYAIHSTNNEGYWCYNPTINKETRNGTTTYYVGIVGVTNTSDNGWPADNTVKAAYQADFDANSTNNQWKFIQENGSVYLYNVGAQKYVTRTDRTYLFTSTKTPLDVIYKNTDNSYAIHAGGLGTSNTSNSQNYACIVTKDSPAAVKNWTSTDHGSKLEFFEIEPLTPYIVAFDKNTRVSGRTDRYQYGHYLKTNTGREQESNLTTIDNYMERPYMYSDNIFVIKEGESVQPKFKWKGAWRYGFVYVDKGQDGTFSVTNNMEDNTDLVSWSVFSRDHSNYYFADKTTNANSNWYNAADYVRTNYLPAFTVSGVGSYRIRFNIAGNGDYVTPQGVESMKNVSDGGGGIVDYTLHVIPSNAVLQNTVSGLCFTQALPSCVTALEALTLTPTLPVNSITIRHGFNMDDTQKDDLDNYNWVEETIQANIDGSVTIPQFAVEGTVRIVSADFKDVPVTITAGNNGNFGTLCLPIATTIPSSVKAYKLTGLSDNHIVFSPIDSDVLPANEPVLLKGESSGTFSFSTTNYEEAGSDNLLLGTPNGEQVDMSNNDIYVLAKQDGDIVFMRTTAANVNARKAYIKLPYTTQTQTFRMVISEEGPTGINANKERHTQSTIYDLGGRNIKKMGNGIYISKERKIIR